MPGLPLVLALHLHEVSAIVILVVGLTALALAAVGYRSQRRTANRALWFVTLAFLLFAVKGIAGSWAIWTRAIPHEHLELVLSAVDLGIVLLLAAPLLARLRGKGG